MHICTRLFYIPTGHAVCLADLVCACTVEQLRLLDTVKEKPDFTDIIRPFPRVRATVLLMYDAVF